MIITIPVPDAKLLIKKGQIIDIGTPLFEEKRLEEIKIPLAHIIHAHPKDIFKHLKKCVGDEIKQGEIIAEHSAFFSKSQYKSEHNGVLKEINHIEGDIRIAITTDKERSVYSCIKGEVVETGKKDIQIKVSKPKEYSVKEIHGQGGGKVVYMENEHQPLTEEMIEDSIIVTPHITGYNQIKLETLGVHGFVTQRQLTEETHTPWVVINTIPDFEEINKNKYPYCFIDEGKSRIIFYH